LWQRKHGPYRSVAARLIFTNQKGLTALGGTYRKSKVKAHFGCAVAPRWFWRGPLCVTFFAMRTVGCPAGVTCHRVFCL
jgi:hypothetical protein